MTTRVKCKICGALIDSTTVEAEEYEEGDIIDMGCPWCGHHVPLLATEDKLAPEPDEPEIVYLSGADDEQEEEEE